MGPSLQTFELEVWAKSRGLSVADAAQLRAVFEERDEGLRLLAKLTPWANCFWRAGEMRDRAIGEARALVATALYDPSNDERAAVEAMERDADLYEKAQLDKLDARKNGDDL